VFCLYHAAIILPICMNSGIFNGTVVLQKIYHENAAEIAKEVNDRIAEIESTMTINKPGGEINLLNDAAGKEYVKLGEDTCMCLTSKTICRD